MAEKTLRNGVFDTDGAVRFNELVKDPEFIQHRQKLGMGNNQVMKKLFNDIKTAKQIHIANDANGINKLRKDLKDSMDKADKLINGNGTPQDPGLKQKMIQRAHQRFQMLQTIAQSFNMIQQGVNSLYEKKRLEGVFYQQSADNKAESWKMYYNDALDSLRSLEQDFGAQFQPLIDILKALVGALTQYVESTSNFR